MVRTDGRTVEGKVTWFPKFLRWADYHIFLGMGLRFARTWIPANKPSQSQYLTHAHSHITYHMGISHFGNGKETEP